MSLAGRTGYKKLYEKLEDYRRPIAEHREVERKVKAMVKEMKNLMRQLAYHDNPNPPSAQGNQTSEGDGRLQEGPAGMNAPTGRWGAQPGHKGATSKPAPTRLETHATL